MKKTVLVTGGAGFIGSWVTEELCNLGRSVRVIDNLSFGFRKFVDKRAEFINGSIGDRKLIEDVLDGVDTVMHLAASSIIKFSFNKPEEYFENNITNALVLLEAMRKKGVNKIVNSSSAAIYGEPVSIPIEEADPKEPITPYGASKLSFENILSSYYHSFGIESVSLRYFNAYGPRDEQQPTTRAVPIWIRQILKGKPVSLYWKGKQVRDYVFVKDIARAHTAVLPLRGFRVYNIGSGDGVLMTDILQSLSKISEKKIVIQDMGERKGDPKKLVADISRIRRDVGWIAKTDLVSGLRETYEYYESVYKSNLR
ncbi:MAG: NAD-dependent epimerase/dehydratase family protein [Candidatus Levybacteria bacterium]|nr:NAD-dependent epimerase/dehydratase family protein [Candidatus Levybacteria bacterium]